MDLVQASLPLIYGAVVVESVITIIKSIQTKETDWRYWASVIGGLVVGIVVAVAYDLDLLSMVGLESKIPYVGAVLTGLIMSRGSNVVNDLIGLVTRASRPTQ